MTMEKAPLGLLILLIPAFLSAPVQATTIIMAPEVETPRTTQSQPQESRFGTVTETAPTTDGDRWPASDLIPNHGEHDLEKGIQERAIIAGDTGFFPKEMSVSRNIPVRLYVTSSSRRALCVMLDSFQVRKEVRPDSIQEITFVPKEPGKYRYYCPLNSTEGTLVVLK